MKRLFPGLLLFFLSTNLFAQQFKLPEYGFRLGLTAHPTIGWVKPETGKSNGISLGFSYGLLGDFNFAENYSFSTGLTITTINGESTEAQTVNSSQIAIERKYKLQYIEIPLTIKLRTGQMGEVRWYGQFGLSNDFKIGAKQSGDGVVKGGSPGPNSESISKYTKFYRAGLIIGAGAEFDVADHTTVAAGLSLNNGFTNIRSNEANSLRNHYIGLNIGVFF